MLFDMSFYLEFIFYQGVSNFKMIWPVGFHFSVSLSRLQLIHVISFRHRVKMKRARFHSPPLASFCLVDEYFPSFELPSDFIWYECEYVRDECCDLNPASGRKISPCGRRGPRARGSRLRH
jgi:hypothetical protein